MQYGITVTPDYEDWYKRLINEVLEAPPRETRNGLTRAIFGKSVTLRPLYPAHIPLLLSRRMYPRGIAGELQTFLEGPRDVQHFKDNGCNYWDYFADEKGNLTVDYGNLWKDFEGVNQLEELIKGLTEDPYGRRHLVSGWHPARLKDLTLPCCHYMYQWFVNVSTGELEMMWIQRSVDVAIGLPSDVVLAFLMNNLVANQVGLQAGNITFVLGDVHIYQAHYFSLLEYLKRESLPVEYTSRLKKSATLFNFKASDWMLEGYEPLDKIPFQIC